MQRRSLLKGLGALGAALWLPHPRNGHADLADWRPATAAAADLDELPPVQGAAWTTALDRPVEVGYVSPPHQAERPFSALAASWLAGPDEAAAANVRLVLRVSADAEAWGDWLPAGLFAARDGERFGRLLDLERPARWVQWRLLPLAAGMAGASLPELKRVTVTTIAAQIAEAPAPAPTGGRPAATYPVWGVPFDDGVGLPWPVPALVPRAAWGATLPPVSDPGYWPPEYDPIEFITVHHTATSNQPPDPAAVVRAIHYYHTYTLDWGDVGYHFLIDPWGTIYQGRGGGENVVAGHVYSYNRFNLGIALLGQFQPGATDVPFAAGQPTEAALSSLIRLAAWAAKRYDIDPAALNLYPLADRRQGPFPGMCAHRDWHDGVHRVFPDQPPPSTECPGDALYARLPGLRAEVERAAAQSQPSRLTGLLAAFSAYETYAPGAVRGGFGYGPSVGLAPAVRYELDVRSLDAHEDPGAGASRAVGSFSFTDEGSGMRLIADRIGYVGVWARGVAQGAFVRGAGRTGSGERADFSLALSQDDAGAAARLWLTSGPGFESQGGLRYGRFVIAR